MLIKAQYFMSKKQPYNQYFATKNQTFHCDVDPRKNLSHSSVTSDPYYKPASLLDIYQLSKILKRPINVWSNDRIICSFNARSKKPAINIEFWEYNASSSHKRTGHFTLRGGREPVLKEPIYPNNCLFDVVAAQTGYEANELRRKVLRRERAKRKKSLEEPSLQRLFISQPGLLRIVGGAKYKGKSKEDAGRLLDASQYGSSHPNGLPGHPRGHASYRHGKGPFDSVENYSKLTNRKKTGFLSRDDQDATAHNALLTTEVQDQLELMNELGKKALKAVVKVPADKLYKPPKVQEWDKGRKFGKRGSIKAVKLVLKHFHEKYDDENCDVFILTFFPEMK